MALKLFRVMRAVCALTAVASWASCAGIEGPARYRALDQQLGALESAPSIPAAANPFAGAPALERSALVAEVLRRNPSVAAARAAWRAALARYPQETSLDDPMLAYGVGPRSFGSHQVDDAAQRVEVSQAFPFPGKLALRGSAAIAEAEASAHDYEAVRLRLAAMASGLFDDWSFSVRAQATNREHLELVRELHRIAISSYESGAGSQQDPLAAEIEEVDLEHRAVELESAREVTAAQIAQLLHLQDGSALPPPPATFLPFALDEGDATAHVERALSERPELRAAEARVHSREAAADLARREFLPDVKLIGMYDGFWAESDLKPYVGLELNVPLRLDKRRAALEQARAELGAAEHERESQQDQVRFEVRSAWQRLHEARHLLALTRDRMLPAARDRLTAARASFATGRVEFRDLIEAERALRNAELGEQESLVDVSRRGAELAAALGVLPGLDTAGGQP